MYLLTMVTGRGHWAAIRAAAGCLLATPRGVLPTPLFSESAASTGVGCL